MKKSFLFLLWFQIGVCPFLFSQEIVSINPNSSLVTYQTETSDQTLLSICDTIASYRNRSTNFFIDPDSGNGYFFGTHSLFEKVAIHFDDPGFPFFVSELEIWGTKKVVMGPPDSLIVKIYTSSLDSTPNQLMGVGVISMNNVNGGPTIISTLIPIQNSQPINGDYVVVLEYGHMNDTIAFVSSSPGDGNGEQRVRLWEPVTSAWVYPSDYTTRWDVDLMVMPIMCDTVLPPTNCLAGFYDIPDTTQPFTTILVNTSTGNGNLSYFWDFGDGNTSNLGFPTHTYATQGNYQVCLTITDSLLCTQNFCDTIVASLKTQSNWTIIVVPNVQQNTTTTLEKKLWIFPNPTSGLISLKSIGFASNETYSISIYNSHGVKIRNSILVSNGGEMNTQIDLTEFPTGLYNLVLNDLNQIAEEQVFQVMLSK